MTDDEGCVVILGVRTLDVVRGIFSRMLLSCACVRRAARALLLDGRQDRRLAVAGPSRYDTGSAALPTNQLAALRIPFIEPTLFQTYFTK